MSSVLERVKAKVALKSQYPNWINGTFCEPADGEYFDVSSPVTGKVYTKAARSKAADIEKALDAAHAAKGEWGTMAPAQRAILLNKVADRVEENIEVLAHAECLDMGKAMREGMAGDMPMVIDHFRYFAACCRMEETPTSQIDNDTIAYHFHEPIGVVGAIIPWNFPLTLMSWKMAPALAAGNTMVIKPAEQSPLSIMVFMELIADLLPAGVVNVVHGFGPEAGQALATNSRVNKLTFTGETSTGKLIMGYAAKNLVPVTLELGGKAPNVFFDDVFAKDDAYADKVMEGFAMFALNKGEVCTCPSRALVHERIYDEFMEKALARVAKITVDNPLELSTMMGPQASKEQFEKVMEYIDIGQKEGAKLAYGGKRTLPGGELDAGYFVGPTIFEASRDMRIAKEEIFGPVVAVTVCWMLARRFWKLRRWRLMTCMKKKAVYRVLAWLLVLVGCMGANVCL